jgi:hypothetical protein
MRWNLEKTHPLEIRFFPPQREMERQPARNSIGQFWMLIYRLVAGLANDLTAVPMLQSPDFVGTALTVRGMAKSSPRSRGNRWTLRDSHPLLKISAQRKNSASSRISTTTYEAEHFEHSSEIEVSHKSRLAKPQTQVSYRGSSGCGLSLPTYRW